MHASARDIHRSARVSNSRRAVLGVQYMSEFILSDKMIIYNRPTYKNEETRSKNGRLKARIQKNYIMDAIRTHLLRGMCNCSYGWKNMCGEGN